MTTVIRQRLAALGLSDKDSVLLPIDVCRSIAIAITTALKEENGMHVAQSFSIEDLSLEDAISELRELPITDEVVYAYWFSFEEAITIRWAAFLEHFPDLWHPGSDDLVVLSMGPNWALEITHEETVRFLQLAKPL